MERSRWVGAATRKPEIIDAEYEIVREAKPRQWNGVGLPPDWCEWHWIGKVFYVLFYGAWLIGLGLFSVWLKGVLPLPDHW